jgi:uncharacterized protein (DUF433 family)
MMKSVSCQTDRRSYWDSRNNFEDSPRDPWPDYDLFGQPPAKNFSVPFSSVLDKARQLSLFVDIDPDVIGGTPRIGGTRIPVHMVLSAVEEYGSISGAVRAYRSLTEDQVRDAIRFSSHVLECPFEYEPANSD